ncbi:TVP38/TMEM64 family protein [Gemmatimonas phototrophica]|nr:TVP38/TMEM64 family protein [Gemmatimonas phototrophica]
MALTLRSAASGAAKLAGMLVPVGLGLGASKLASPYMPGFTEWVNTLGPWAPVAFVVGYIVATVCMMPAFLLTIAGGAVFGMLKGSVLVLIGSTIGAAIAFTLGRTVLRSWVAAQIAKNQTLQIVDRVVGQEGLKLMFLLRLSGIAPFVLTNYAMGVTSVSLTHFLLALLGMLPTIATYTAVGQSGAQTPGAGAIPSWILWMGISAAVILAVTITRIVQKALREAQMRHDMERLAEMR